MAPRKKTTRNAKSDYALTKKINQAIQRNIETKFIVWPYNTTIQDPGRVTLDNPMLNMASGSTPNTRVGNQIYCTGLHGKFVLRNADTTNIVRMVLYIPKDPTDTLQASSVDYLEAIDLDRFTILMDRVYHLNDAGGNQRMVTIGKKFNTGTRRGIQVQYTTTSGLSCIKNNIRLYWVSDSGAIPDPIIEGYIRAYYKDA